MISQCCQFSLGVYWRWFILQVFSLPHLKPVCKVKLTAQDGSRVRKIAFVNFRSKSGEFCIFTSIRKFIEIVFYLLYSVMLALLIIVSQDNSRGLLSRRIAEVSCLHFFKYNLFAIQFELPIIYVTTTNCALEDVAS